MLTKEKVARNFARVLSTVLAILIFAVIYPNSHFADGKFDFDVVIYLSLVFLPLIFTYQTKYRWLKLLGWLLLCALLLLVLVMRL